MIEHYRAIQTIGAIADHHATRFPDAIGLIDGEEKISFVALAERSNCVANGLLAAGLTAGSRVALIAPDSATSYELLLGCNKIGAVLVPLNWRLDDTELFYCIEDAAPDAMFVSDAIWGRLNEARTRFASARLIVNIDGSGELVSYRQWRDQQSATPVAKSQSSDVVVQIYTSGTSGLPKGVLLTSQSFLATARNVEESGGTLIGWREGDVSLLALPTFHVGGLWWGVHGLINAATNIVMPAFNAMQAVRMIENHKVTLLAMVPAMLRFLLSEPATDGADLSSVRQIIYGGSPMSPVLRRQAMARFRCRFAQNYGLSETCNMAAFLPPEEHDDTVTLLPSVAGRPLFGIEVKVIDANGAQLATEQIGEICFRTPGAMVGYWRRPEETSKTLVDGWIHTGDAGFVDYQGYVHITDRIKDMIISAGENIYPAEIEARLLEHPDVIEAAVIGVPDERWGETPMAFVVVRPGATITGGQILRTLRLQLAEYKLPRKVELMSALPRNASGKILKRVMREPYWQDLMRRVN